MNKHILFVIDYFTPHRGGVETVFENIIKRLINKGYKISVLTSKFDNKLKKIEKVNNESDDLTIYRIGKTRISFSIGAIFLGIKILKKEKDIKAIHASTYGGAIPGSILGFLFKKKVILTIHEIFGKLRGFYKGNFIGFFYKLYENLIFKFPYDIYHCVSTYTLNSVRIYYGLKDSKLRMIYNGVDTDFWNINKIKENDIKNTKHKYGLENKINILYYGHAGKSKGIDYLVESIPKIFQLNSKINLILNLIDCKRKTKIISNIKKLKHGNNIIIIDGLEILELRNLIASCDIIIAPSISEGFGSVHTESVAMGKSLLTTNVASIPEVVRGKVKFINPKSSNEIVIGIKEILDGNIENIPTKIFSWDESTQKIENLYT